MWTGACATAENVEKVKSQVTEACLLWEGKTL